MSIAVVLPEKVAANADSLSTLKTITSLCCGAAAGILGLTGWLGALFFIVHSVSVAFGMQLLACGGRPEVFFADGTKQFRGLGQLMSGTMTFIVAWTVVYDSIYIF
jgi:hypothetical protein